MIYLGFIMFTISLYVNFILDQNVNLIVILYAGWQGNNKQQQIRCRGDYTDNNSTRRQSREGKGERISATSERGVSGISSGGVRAAVVGANGRHIDFCSPMNENGWGGH